MGASKLGSALTVKWASGNRCSKTCPRKHSKYAVHGRTRQGRLSRPATVKKGQGACHVRGFCKLRDSANFGASLQRFAYVSQQFAWQFASCGAVLRWSKL